MARRLLGCALVLGVLLVVNTAEATVLRQHYEFAEPAVEVVDGTCRVTMENAWSYGAPGEPVLPMVGAQILLPPGEVIADLEIIPGEKVTIKGTYLVEPGQLQYPLSFTGPPETMQPNEAIYGSGSPFPGKLHDEPQSGLFRGYRIASFALHPIEYVPSDGRLSYLKSLEVKITTAPSADALTQTARMVRHDATTLSRISGIVDNPSGLGGYGSVERIHGGTLRLDPDLEYKYIIVTTDAWDDYLDPLVEFATQRGHKAGVFLKSWIFENYTQGVDDQDNIRDFIIDAYETWDIDYVLLVGDAREADGIPHRGLYSSTAYGVSDTDIPADLYYGCLDGNWNNDGDNRWGEPGEEDFYHDVGVGRACVDDATEIQNFVVKVMRYQDEPIVSESDEALMAGELLWADPTWGGDYKDEIKDGASTHGYTTVGFAPTMNVGTLYDRDYTWTASELLTLMENGLNIVNHLGHCNVNYSMRMYIPDIASFDNDGTVHTYNFVYSQGCYCGSFDNRNTSGGYGEDCFAEEFQTDDDGAVAVVMNSRYGWGEHMGTNGSSQYFDRQFFDAIFGEQIYPIADVNDDSKMDNIWAINYGANRWCYYDLNVFGDPAMHLWTAEPGELDVSHVPAILIGAEDLDVTVMAAGGGPIEGARVTIYTDDYSVYDTDLTDATGNVTLHPNASYPGVLYVKATAHDYLVSNTEIQIIPPEGPYLVIEEVVYLDGGGDGLVNAGEAVEMQVKLKNVGVELATAISATISTEDEYVNITVNTQTFPDIPAGGEAWGDGNYAFDVSPNCPDEHHVVMPTVIEGEERLTWETQIYFTVHAPVISILSIDIDDTASGNGNLRLDPGEDATVAVVLHNAGTGRLDDITGVFTCNHPLVTILSGTGSIPGLGEDESGLLEPVFEVSVDPAFNSFETDFYLYVTGTNSFGQLFDFRLSIGGFYETVEEGAGDWVHYVVTGGFADQWHVSESRNHTPGGTKSWKCGDTGTGNYANLLDAGLETPAVNLFGEGELLFWMWIDAEESAMHSGRAYDGGLVEMSVDGGPFEQITPVGGYTHTIREGSTPGPFPEGTPVFSGNYDWQLVNFDLPDVVGNVAFRFRFGADGADACEGWYIDDIEILGLGQSAGIEAEDHSFVRMRLDSGSPNPFGMSTRICFSLPEAGHAELEVFDPTGRLIRTLLNGKVPAGTHALVWEGDDETGRQVASGLYYYRLSTEEGMLKRSMVLLR
ncbi:MAG: hypothetical protein KAY24_12290 [Candidatus Eisenbacteria sp.]|nr:hypothetical protein [Candidatus Eisenbacteria bacterium]